MSHALVADQQKRLNVWTPAASTMDVRHNMYVAGKGYFFEITRLNQAIIICLWPNERNVENVNIDKK